MHVFRRSAFACLLAASSVSLAAPPACPDVAQPPAAVCIASPHGLAYADTEADAREASRLQAEAADRFATFFGAAPTGVLVLSSSYRREDARAFAQAHGVGYAQVWLTSDANAAMAGKAMRQAGLKASQVRAGQERARASYDDLLRHELGHVMHAHAYWPDAVAPAQPHYGSPAPDWLDEAAALLIESPQATVARVSRHLAAAARGQAALPELAPLLVASHPALATPLARAMSRGPASGSGIRMMMMADDANGLAAFYDGATMLALFLIDASGDGRVLASISDAFRAGRSFDDWLATEGAQRGLPPTLPALQASWTAWQRRLPGGGAPPR